MKKLVASDMSLVTSWCGYGWLDADTLTINYATNGMPDYGANQMYQAAVDSGADHGSMPTLPEIPGLAVWKSGHIGIYKQNTVHSIQANRKTGKPR